MSRRRRAAAQAARARSRAAQLRRDSADEPGRWAIAGTLVLVLLPVAAVVALVTTPWMGRGLAVLLPGEGAQRATAIGLGVLLAASVVARVSWPAARRLRLGAVATAAAVVLYLIAPFGRGHSIGRPAAADSVPTLVQTGYRVWLALIGLLLAVKLGQLVLDRGWAPRPPRPPREPEPTGVLLRRLWPSAVIAAGVPLLFVATTLRLGAGAETSLPSTGGEPVAVRVPALTGSPLDDDVLVGELDGVAEAQALDRASRLTGGASPLRTWTVEAVAAAVPGGRGTPFPVAVVVTPLQPGTDLARVATRLGAAGPPSTDGWVLVPAEPGTAVALADAAVLTLRVDWPDPAARSAELTAVAAALTPQLRSALVSATGSPGR